MQQAMQQTQRQIATQRAGAATYVKMSHDLAVPSRPGSHLSDGEGVCV